MLGLTIVVHVSAKTKSKDVHVSLTETTISVIVSGHFDTLSCFPEWPLLAGYYDASCLLSWHMNPVESRRYLSAVVLP